jgi:hypothetical protein
MKKAMAPNTADTLKKAYSKIKSFPMAFRKKVQNECGWGTPTYYRKMKEYFSGYKSLTVASRKTDKKQAIPTAYKPLSNAEREMIITILDEMFTDLEQSFQEYRKSIVKR